MKHEAFIRMILDGPDEGQWIAYCKDCDWHIDPRPIDPTLGRAVEDHMREARLRDVAEAARRQTHLDNRGVGLGPSGRHESGDCTLCDALRGLGE